MVGQIKNKIAWWQAGKAEAAIWKGSRLVPGIGFERQQKNFGARCGLHICKNCFAVH
jgi:hypothetical protein